MRYVVIFIKSIQHIFDCVANAFHLCTQLYNIFKLTVITQTIPIKVSSHECAVGCVYWIHLDARCGFSQAGMVLMCVDPSFIFSSKMGSVQVFIPSEVLQGLGESSFTKVFFHLLWPTQMKEYLSECVFLYKHFTHIR